MALNAPTMHVEFELLLTHFELRVLRSSIRQKRKMDLHVNIPTGLFGSTKRTLPKSNLDPSKPKYKLGPSKTITVNKNNDGFFDVNIQYSHATNLALGVGVNPKEINIVVEEDNEARRIANETNTEEPL